MHNRNSNPRYATMSAKRICSAKEGRKRRKRNETKRKTWLSFDVLRQNVIISHKEFAQLGLISNFLAWESKSKAATRVFFCFFQYSFANFFFLFSFRLKNKCWCRNGIFLVFYASRKRKKLRSRETKTQLLKSHIVVKLFLEFHLSHSLFVALAPNTEREREKIVLRSKSRKWTSANHSKIHIWTLAIEPICTLSTWNRRSGSVTTSHSHLSKSNHISNEYELFLALFFIK